ncbi:MAG: hypothetical protein F4W90_00690 [Gammaproteobacteria bacterium]|nr:hypothetical protein [Gammaproteobacteria bacterium]
MSNWEDRLQEVWDETRDLFLTVDAVLLGVCAHLSRKLGIPVVALRILGLICAFMWPQITAVVYVGLRFFIDPDSQSIS